MRLIPKAAFVALLVSMLAAGCSKSTGGPGANAPPATETASTESAASGHSHDGWWCDEHGVPEEVCALCNSKLVAGFKEKGDWCDEHDRPESQCFICHPEKEAEFAAEYEARFGAKPPKPQEEAGEGHSHGSAES